MKKKFKFVHKTGKVFEDKRGYLLKILDKGFSSSIEIFSKKGTIRANHYHKKDWHYCYVLKGKIAYYHRRHGIKTKPKKIIINEGELFFTPPMVDHAMKFLSYTEFLALGRWSLAYKYLGITNQSENSSHCEP